MLDEIQKRHLENLKEIEREELSNNKEAIELFQDYAAQRSIILEPDNFRYFQTTGVVAIYPNLLPLLNSSIAVDKEDLFDFKELCLLFEKKRFMPGYLSNSDYSIMAHPYFRRVFREINNYAPRFIDLFWSFNSANIQSYISLDLNRVRIDKSDFGYMELDTWFGAKFEKTIENISDGIVKLRPPLDLENRHIDFIFANAYSLDIKWTTKGNIKSFQLEEFKDETIKIFKNETEFYPVRYVHAEYDLSSQNFRHFDGAIHFYTKEEYFQRRDSDFNYNSKNISHIKTLSQKLFKMNGVVPVEKFIEFTSHFLTGNPLIIEYFEGKYPEQIQKILDAIRVKNAQ